MLAEDIYQAYFGLTTLTDWTRYWGDLRDGGGGELMMPQ